MPNIAITTYCNLHCPYCFADTMIHEEDIKNISLEQFKFILNWILKSKPNNTPVGHIGLIGGEPTLHPQFLDILKIIEEKQKDKPFQTILFTNGIYLEKYINYIPKNLHILLNYNTPSAMTPEQWQMLQSTLQHAHELGWLNDIRPDVHNSKITLGCNICHEIVDYSFLWDAVRKYNLHNVRVSVTAPTKPEYKNDKELYYTTMKPQFLSFVKDAEKNCVILGRDCNQIPDCFFTDEELKLVKSIMPDKKDQRPFPHCGPIIDITPDFTASSCFGAYETVDCSLFNNFQELEYYLLHTFVIPKMKRNNTGPCATCTKHELLQCQGGCLAFAKST